MVALDPASAARLASPAMLLTLMSAVVEQQKLENIEKVWMRSSHPFKTYPDSSKMSGMPQ
ncbi:hypothetical protein RAA17_14230 [Komagataeibacter rhaeticus]|nr:hypothetical protein [Komagataeibacter rhaeticus]